MKPKANVKAGNYSRNRRAPLVLIAAAAVLTIGRPASAALVEISAGPNGWGCSQCSGPPQVLPGTVVNLVNSGESGPLQLILGAGTYTITNAETTGNYSGWNFNGYPSSGNWVWSFMIASDNGNGTATVLNDDYVSGIFATQAAAAAAVTATWDGTVQLPGNSTASFTDSLTLSSTTTLDFFIDDYFLPDNGGGVSLNITAAGSGAPEPASFVLIGAGLIGLSVMRRKADSH